VLSPQVLYGTSLALEATAVSGPTTIELKTPTGKLVLRLREPASGPITGYIIDDNGTPTLVMSLALYLDAPDMLDNHDMMPTLFNHDLHSKPLTVTLRGPMRFLPDGRLVIAVANIEDVPIIVNIDNRAGSSGSVEMLVPRGEMKIQLASRPLRGGLR
jgi:hypothetical protein